MELFFSFKK